MRIIAANKYYYLKGGAERYLFDLRDALRQHGHEVIPFAMQDERNEKSSWDKFFVSAVQTERVKYSLGGLKTAGRVLYSFEAQHKFAALLRETKPELLHVHNIYNQISPSILSVARREAVPTVMTVHDYAMLAPNYSLYHDGAICEVTKPDHFWRAVDHRCVKRSSAASAVGALALKLHRWLGLYDSVDRFIAPSRFVQALLAEYGVPAERIVHLPYAIDLSDWTATRSGDYMLYVGRLSPEKGVDVLIRAAARRKNMPVRIVGVGPDEERLRTLAEKLGATNVTFRGFKQGGELRAEYAGARAVVVPSVWYEVFGLVALEAYASGKPVVASALGGLSEMVKDGVTGFLVSAGDDADLADKLGALWDAPAAATELGAAGRAWVERDFRPEAHYEKLWEIYEQAIADTQQKKKLAR